MLTHLPGYKNRHCKPTNSFFLHQRDQDKFFRVLHLDYSMAGSGSQPGHPAQQPYDMEQEKAWGSANVTQRSHSNMTSSMASSLHTASEAFWYFSKGRAHTKGRARSRWSKAGFAEMMNQEREPSNAQCLGLGTRVFCGPHLGLTWVFDSKWCYVSERPLNQIRNTDQRGCDCESRQICVWFFRCFSVVFPLSVKQVCGEEPGWETEIQGARLDSLLSFLWCDPHTQMWAPRSNHLFMVPLPLNTVTWASTFQVTTFKL